MATAKERIVSALLYFLEGINSGKYGGDDDLDKESILEDWQETKDEIDIATVDLDD